MIERLSAYVRGIARRDRIESELDEELQFHLEQEIEAHVARGLSPSEARRRALLAFGGVTHVKDAVRDVRTLRADLLWRDVRHSLRSLRSTPAFTIVALTVLTLSVGATTAIFSVVDGVILRALPFAESDRLVAIVDSDITGQSDNGLKLVTPQEFLDWRDQQDVFTEIGAVSYAEISLQRDGAAQPENLRAQRVTADFFSLLRVTPLLGRAFARADEAEGQAPAAVISYGLWQRRFGGRPDVIGARLPTPLVSFEIVGVMPPNFNYPVDSYVLGVREPVEVWVPCVFTSADRIRGNSIGRNFHVIGRLRNGISIEQAQARMVQISASLAVRTPRWFEDRVFAVEPLHQFVIGGVRTWLFMLLAAVTFVLLIACVNVANLMLVRASARVRELGIRAALGASRGDLARALLIESLILSLAGAALGAMLAWWGVEALRSLIPAEVPRTATFAVDLRVLVATAGVAMLTGIAFAVAPILQFSRPHLSPLHDGERASTAGTRTTALRATLVVAEVALAVVLLVGSGLFLASFARVINVDLGFDHRDVMAFQIRVIEIPANVQRAAERNRQLLLNVLERVRAMPGVERASLLGGGLPLRGDLRTEWIAIPGRELPRNSDIDLNQISPDYFATVGVPLLRGRALTEADTQNSEPVIILNQAAAERYFPGDDAIGKVVRVSGTRTVVGVVGNVRHYGPEGGWRTQAFVPIAQSRVLGGTLVVRTAPGADGVSASVRQAIWTEFPDSVPARIDDHPLGYYFDALVAQRRFNMLLLGLFGLLGLVIASAGIYGVMTYVVGQRTQEIGIRMALGARPSRILTSILGGAMLSVAIGLAIGIGGSWALAGLIEGFLFGIQPHEPAVYAGVLAVLAATGLVAALLPARRAARVDPLVALRME